VRTLVNGRSKMLVIVLLSSLLVVAGCGLRNPLIDNEQPQGVAARQPPADEKAQASPGFRAPDFTATDVITGETISLGDLRGQVVMVNFWATWCGPCRVEMPAMEEYFKETDGTVRMVAIGADAREKPERLAAFAHELGLTFNIAFDEGQAALAYNSFGLPTSIFIDQNGIVRGRHTGAMNVKQIRDLASKTAELGGK
jgi:thiol-disulfide isomerase/thioredoxin